MAQTESVLSHLNALAFRISNFHVELFIPPCSFDGPELFTDEFFTHIQKQSLRGVLR